MENHQNSSYRYERKFFVYNVDRISIQQIILNLPTFFSEIYQERYINNIYFDYLGFNNLVDNIEGNMYRTKYRIRWYGNMFSEVTKPKLEVKIKKGLIGTKRSYDINRFQLTKGINLSRLKNLVSDSLADSLVRHSLEEQYPVMLNRYKRKYFESCDKKFRITIDDNQSFYKLNTFNNSFLQSHKDLYNVIIELKYDKKYEIDVARITNKLPFRLSKSSKYARGIELLYI